MTKLTEHFTLEEMQKSEAATRRGINNSIPIELVANAKLVAEHLEIIRDYYDKPIRITSCYRGPAVNEAIGGSLTSAHMKAMAADTEVDGVGILELCRKAAELIGDYDQIIYEFGESGWMHIGFAHGTPRKQLLTATKINGKTVYVAGLIETKTEG